MNSITYMKSQNRLNVELKMERSPSFLMALFISSLKTLSSLLISSSRSCIRRALSLQTTQIIEIDKNTSLIDLIDYGSLISKMIVDAMRQVPLEQ